MRLILHQVSFSQSQHCHCLVKDFFSKCKKICSFLRIYSHLQKKSINFYFLQRHYEQEDFIVLGLNRRAFLERQIHYIFKIVVFIHTNRFQLVSAVFRIFRIFSHQCELRQIPQISREKAKKNTYSDIIQGDILK